MLHSTPRLFAFVLRMCLPHSLNRCPEYIRLHTEIPRIDCLRRRHCRIPLLSRVLGRARRRGHVHLHEGAFLQFHDQPMLFEIMLFQQMSQVADRCCNGRITELQTGNCPVVWQGWARGHGEATEEIDGILWRGSRLLDS